MECVKNNRIFLAAAVFAAVLAMYWPCRRFSFVRLDDQDYVYQNTHIRDGLTSECAEWAFRDVGYASNWHPLTWMSLAADVSLSRWLGLDVSNGVGTAWTSESGALPGIMHLHNAVLHAMNAALLVWLIAAVCGKSGVFVALAALAWAVHPLRCEAVCWVSERKELLAVFFMLSAFVLYMRLGRWCYLLSLGCFVLALLSKPVAVSLPVALMGYDLGIRREKFVRVALRMVPFAAFTFVVCLVTLGAQKEALDVGDAVSGWGMRIVTAMQAPAVYLWQTVWPAGLCVLYPTHDGVVWPYFIAGLVLLAAMGWVVWRWLLHGDRWSGLGIFAAGWCYAGLVPMLGLVKVGGQPHSDRYTYWVGCGIVVVTSLLGKQVSAFFSQRGKRWALGVLVATVAMYGFAGTVRAGAWRNSLSLYADAVEKTSDEESALILADEMCRLGADGKNAAVRMLGKVLSIRKTPKSRGGLALFMAMHCGTVRGVSLVEARMLAERALEDDPGCGEAYAALGFADIAEGKRPQAAERFRAAFSHGYINSRIEAQIESGKFDGENGK